MLPLGQFSSKDDLQNEKIVKLSLLCEHLCLLKLLKEMIFVQGAVNGYHAGYLSFS